LIELTNCRATRLGWMKMSQLFSRRNLPKYTPTLVNMSTRRTVVQPWTGPYQLRIAE
jgi:hypothetical protein